MAKHRSTVACLVLILGIILAGTCSNSASALAQAYSLVGAWDGVTTLNGIQVPLRYVITAGNAITRKAWFPSGSITYWGNYEMVGNQLHCIWRHWAPRQHLFQTGPLMDDCMVQFESPNVFDCGGIRFRRERVQ
jgi:hypothetical protein